MPSSLRPRVAKWRRRSEARGPLLAFLQTFGEALLALLFVRFVYRLVGRGLARAH